MKDEIIKQYKRLEDTYSALCDGIHKLRKEQKLILDSYLKEELEQVIESIERAVRDFEPNTLENFLINYEATYVDFLAEEDYETASHGK